MVAVAAFRLIAIPVRAQDILAGRVIIGNLLVAIEIPCLVLLLHTLRLVQNQLLFGATHGFLRLIFRIQASLQSDQKLGRDVTIFKNGSRIVEPLSFTLIFTLV